MRSRITAILLGGLLLTGGVQAQQSIPPVHPQYTAMLDAMSASVKGRVLVFAPTISDLTMADILRQTALDTIRKTNVRIVTIPYYNYTAKSAILGLALANVPVYEVQTSSIEAIVIVDNQGWRGRGLGTLANPTMKPMTIEEINSILTWFKNVTAKTKRMSQVEAFTRIKQVLK
ncbi:hypothetical protein [Deinococcus fonticola]|uniref:hypothetical protein n=1 Tax=Deinococcus fonticola TaxID=2528713 RepID=UPI001075670A|nr:hypothetical protein [Deinococcus fonticola]